MDWPHIHIMINHFPIILAVIGFGAAILGMLRGRRGTWLYATASLTLAALTVVPTYFTGEPAAEALHRPWYIARGSIHTHEQAALFAAVLTGLAGLIALVAWRRLVRYPRELTLPGGLRAAVVVSSLLSAASIGYTSWLGGRIIHDAPALQGPAPAGVVTEPGQARLAPPTGASTPTPLPVTTSPLPAGPTTQRP